MKITKSIYALMMFAGILAFSACGSDDDSYTFETPQYENISRSTQQHQTLPPSILWSLQQVETIL